MNSLLSGTIGLGILFGSLGMTSGMPARGRTKEVIAYVFAKDRVIGRDEVAATKLTRINYAFANIRDGEVVEGFAHDRENFEVLNGLKQNNPKLKVVVSVGGWTWSGNFSDVALTPQSRRKFIDSATRFIRKYNLDGVDIDWEYPGAAGDGNKFRAEDKQNYTALLRELRERLNEEGRAAGRHFITSTATGASAHFLERTEMAKAQRYVDSVNLMSYDYYEPDSDPLTGNHSPLYTEPTDPKHVSTDASVRLYEAAGVPARKIVVGVPFYGHAWNNVDAKNNGLFQAGTKTTLEANYNAISGTLLAGTGFRRYWDEKSSVPYLYNAATRTFISYEDPKSIALKCKYVLRHNLGGMMFWEYFGDSPDHTLLDAIDKGLHVTGGTRLASEQARSAERMH
jgi:chitinase